MENQPKDLSRVDYLWITKESAARLSVMVEARAPLEDWFKELDRAIGDAAQETAEWQEPARIGVPLARMGIIGTGTSSVAYTEAFHNRTAGELALKLTTKLTVAVAAQMSFVSTFMRIAGVVLRVVSKDLSARGFLLNTSDESLTFVTGTHQPWFENCGGATGPLSTVLPPPQKIVDPYSGHERDCVALQLLGVNNNIKLVVGMNACYILERAGGRYTGIAFGMPQSYSDEKKKNAPPFSFEHSILWPAKGPDASAFFEDWKQGKLGNPPSRPKEFITGPEGSSTIWPNKVGLTKRSTTFGMVFTGGK